MIISRDICLRRKKKERKPSDTLGIENNEWYQIKSEGWGGGSLRHNTMNTTDPFLPVTQTSLPVAAPSLGETMEVEGPIFYVGVEEGAQLLVDYIYFFLLSTEVWKFFFFNFEVDWALAELMSWTRWIGLRLAFILQMKKYLLSCHNLFLFSLELVWKNSLWETERGVRRGTDGMGWADHWDESSVKRGCMKEEWKSGAIYMLIYGHWWPSNRLKSNKLLILSNQMYVQFE